MTRMSAGAAVSALVIAACGAPAGPTPKPPPLPPAAPLSVRLAPSVLSCYPRPSRPCVVGVQAVVSSPANLPLSYVWSGCGSGTSSTSSCTFDRPGESEVVVEVTDALGQVARAAAMARAVNQPPLVTISSFAVFESAGSIEVAAYATDEVNSCSWDTHVVTAGGICERGYFRCFVGNLEVGARKSAPAGQCELTLTVTDEWGLSGTSTRTFTLPLR